MQLVVQRVNKARVTIDGKTTSQIKKGLVVFIGIEKNDTENQAEALAEQLLELRILTDPQASKNRMRLSLKDVPEAEVLLIPEITLAAFIRKGRLSFDASAKPKPAAQLFDYFTERLKEKGYLAKTGQFGALMDVELVNDGPVTIVLRSSS